MAHLIAALLLAALLITAYVGAQELAQERLRHVQELDAAKVRARHPRGARYGRSARAQPVDPVARRRARRQQPVPGPAERAAPKGVGCATSTPPRPAGRPARRLPRLAGKARQSLRKRPAGAHLHGRLGNAGQQALRRSSGRGGGPSPTNPCTRPQEFDRRFRAWSDNLEYALQYNARHESHWVRIWPHGQSADAGSRGRAPEAAAVRVDRKTAYTIQSVRRAARCHRPTKTHPIP